MMQGGGGRQSELKSAVRLVLQSPLILSLWLTDGGGAPLAPDPTPTTNTVLHPVLPSLSPRPPSTAGSFCMAHLPLFALHGCVCACV